MAEKKEEAKSARKEDAKPAAAAPAKNNKKRRLMMVVMIVVLLGAGGGAWWFTQGDKEEATHEVKAKAAPTLPPVYVALDPFTVNLQPEEVGSQYMQVSITLKIAGQILADKLKEQMPEVRNQLLLALSSKKASEVLMPEGKTRLARELLVAITRILEPEAAKEAVTAPISVAAAATDTRTDAAGQAPDSAPPAEGSSAEPTAQAPAGEAADAAPAANPADNANAGPVLGVLFTSLIIQ